MAPNHCRRKLFLAALAAVFCLSSTVQAQPPEGQDKPGGAQGTPLFDPDRPPGTVEEVFVTHANEDVFEVFPRLPGANAVPLRKVTQPASNVATTTRSIAVDLIHNEVLIGNDGVSSIVAYSRTANGNATPLRTLAGPRTQLGSPCAIALDTVHDEIVVVDGKFDSVVVFARTAAGDTPPLRSLSLPAPAAGGDRGLCALAVDPVHDEMFVGLYGHVAVFSRLASGNASPLRTLFGPPDMRLDSPVSAYVDPSHGEVGFGIYSRGGMLVFDRTASGTEAPLRVLNGDNFSFQSLALDEMNDELWAVSDLPWGVERYARTASGNAAPLRRLGTGGIAVALAINYPGAHIDKTFDPWDPYPDIWGPLLLSGTSTALYLPAKLGFAVIGGAVATPLSYLVSLGDAEVARLAWQTSTGGDYVVTPRMIQRGGPVRFLGPSE